MSYNILKKNVRFSGGDDGTIEGIVDISGSQQIVGDKTFTSTITSSADVMVSGSGKISASFFYGDGSTLSGLPSGIGGSNAQVQFNDDGVHGGSADFTFATGSSTLSVNTGSVEVLSASNYISASTYYGDGSNLTNLGEASSVAASNIVGSVIATQVSHSSPLTASGGNLTVRLNNNQGIVDDAGLALDIGQFGSITNFSDSHVILVSGSVINNKKMTIGILESNLSVNLTNSVGTLPSDRLPSEITASFSGSLAQYTELTASTALISGDLITHNIYPEADEQYDIGQDGLGYENLYAKFLNGGITFSAVNDEGATISKGDVVYIKGISGQTPTVGLAACDDPAKMPAFGLVGDGSITNGSTGRIVTFGRLNGFDTSTFSEGDTLFVQTGSGGTSGSLTNVAPTGSGNLLQNIGKVTYSNASGQVRVGGAGRTNATPNLDEGYIFIGNSTDQSVQDNTIYVSSSVNRVGINNTNPQHTLSVDGEISASSYISASSFANAVGTLITADGDFQGNNALFNEITASSVISSSAQISASSFHGDGSALTNLPSPQYRYAYYNGFASLGVISNFINFTALGVGTNLANLRGGILIAPSSGSVVSVRVTPTDNANTAAQDESIIVAITKNGVNTLADCETNGALLLAATGSFSDPISFYDDTGGTTNTYSANLDLKNNSPVITGSLDFDPGDILGLNLRTPDGAVNECGVTLVLKFQED